MHKEQEAYDVLNEMLVDLFHEILEIEESSVQNSTNCGLSMTEIHTLVAIGTEDKSMSEVASALGVTISTLTTAVNKLENKNFVQRERDANDRRVVHISLTDRGRAMCAAHDRFHRRMTRAAIDGLTQEEIPVLASALNRLKDFFYQELESNH